MINEYNDLTYMIFNVLEINKINFKQVLETSPETLKKSNDNLKTFVKWSGNMPTCVRILTTKEGPYTHQEMLDIMLTPEWEDPNPPYGG